MIRLDDFTPVTLESKIDFDRFYKNHAPLHSDYMFTTMIAWHEYGHYEYAFVDGSLCLKTTVDDVISFRPPVGTINAPLFDGLISLAEQYTSEELFSMVTKDVKQWIEKHYPSSIFESVNEYDDYVYLSNDLYELKGSDYRKIRNRLNKFVKNFDYEVIPFTDENLNEVRQFLRRWCIWRDCEGDPLLEYEKKALMFTIDHFDELNLSGIAIRVNDHIEAISIYEQMKPDTVVVHFEKGSPYYDGIYKVVNMETARLVKDVVRYINRESDMGNPGLRKAKQSYRPDHKIHVYTMNKG